MTLVSDGRISDDLRHLTRLLDDAGSEASHGLLGGEYGYGTDYENDVFEMHPQWWGDCECGFNDSEWAWEESHPHAGTCYQSVIRARGFIDYDDLRSDTMPHKERDAHNDEITTAVSNEMGLDPYFGSHVHCTCEVEPERVAWYAANDHNPKCGVARPNFLHKPTGTRVDWYKYIGRSMEHAPIGRDVWRDLIDECEASIPESVDSAKDSSA